MGRTEPIPLPGRLEPDDYEDDIEDVRRRLSAEEERNRVRERLLARAVDAIDRLGARALTAWDRATTQSPGLLYGVFVVFAGQGWYGHDLLSLRADFERAADEYQIDPEAFERLTQRCTECEPDYDLEFEADREDILESEGDLKFEVDPDEDEGASGPRLADLLGDGIGPDEWFDERFDG